MWTRCPLQVPASLVFYDDTAFFLEPWPLYEVRSYILGSVSKLSFGLLFAIFLSCLGFFGFYLLSSELNPLYSFSISLF